MMGTDISISSSATNTRLLGCGFTILFMGVTSGFSTLSNRINCVAFLVIFFAHETIIRLISFKERRISPKWFITIIVLTSTHLLFNKGIKTIFMNICIGSTIWIGICLLAEQSSKVSFQCFETISSQLLGKQEQPMKVLEESIALMHKKQKQRMKASEERITLMHKKQQKYTKKLVDISISMARLQKNMENKVLDCDSAHKTLIKMHDEAHYCMNDFMENVGALTNRLSNLTALLEGCSNDYLQARKQWDTVLEELNEISDSP